MHDVTLQEVFLDESYFEVPTILFDIYVEAIDRVVGRVEYRHEEKQDLKYYGNIGYVVYVPYRGQNYAYKATKQLIEILKQRIEGLYEIYITCNPDNIPSKKTIEKLDAKYIGRTDVDKSHELYRLGDKQKDIYILYV